MKWTPVMRGMCTLHELETIYSLTDVIEMHEAIADTLLLENTNDTR